MSKYDVAIIGSGPAGYVAGIRLSQLGKTVCVLETSQERLGGVCLNEGCIPTKSLINTAEIVDIAKASGKSGLDLELKSLDFNKMVAAALGNSAKLRSGISFLFKKNKIDLIIGQASFKSAKTLNVISDGKNQEICADYFLIATGSRPKVLTGLEPDGKRVLISPDIFKLKILPKNILIIGAGAIGVEFGWLFQTLGSKVTLVEVTNQVLPLEDADIALEITKYLKKRGVQIYTESKVAKLEKNEDICKVEIKTANSDIKREFDYCLLCVGRSANIENLGLEQLGVEMDKGFIKVNSHMQTSQSHIYAAGDCINSPMLAHVASAEGIVAAEAICGKNPQALNYDNIPSAVYSAFQVGRVGLTEKAAREKGLDIAISKHFFKACGKAVLLGKDEGFVKIIAERNIGQIIGVHIVGPEASELIHEFVIAKNNNLKIQDIANTIHSHPTLSEIAVDAAKAVFDKPIHG
jgi:dihydrolipoamide dehydrogenase